MGMEEVVTLNETCRACLLKTNNMRVLDSSDEEVISLITKLSSLCNFEVELNDTLPNFLCWECEEKLQVTYEFQQLCLKSQQLIVACLTATQTLVRVNTIEQPLRIEKIKLNLDGERQNLEIIQLSQEIPEEMPSVYEESKTDLSSETDEMFQNHEKNVIVLNDYLKNKQNQSLNISQDDEGNCSLETDNLNEYNEEDKRGFFKESFHPIELEKKTKNNQTMRLAQYSAMDIDIIIKKFREKFFTKRNCFYCCFTARDSRSLSVHMTRIHKTEKETWCVWCNKNFENIKDHMTNLHKDEFKCPLCGKHQTNTGHFMEHLASHSIDRKYVCNLCEKAFISARHLKSHYKNHANGKSYSCKVCLKMFIFESSLRKHLKTHSKRILKIKQEILGKVDNYEDNSCIKGGLGSIMEVIPQNFCMDCNKKVRSLKEHAEIHHSDKEKIQEISRGLCTYCGKQFRSKSKLSVHMRIHTGEVPYKCSYCFANMSTRSHLVVHERIHTGEKPHVCKICGRGFAQSSVLNVHMKLHTGRSEECMLCSKKFCRPSELRLHMRVHTGEKPFSCFHCGKSFIQKSHLIGHTATHSSERPFKCEYCDKNFKHLSSLKAHNNIHVGKKPYKCSQCSYACRQSHSLSQHMLQHENDESKLDRTESPSICDNTFETLPINSSVYSNQHGLSEDKHMEGVLNEISTDLGVKAEILQQFTQ